MGAKSISNVLAVVAIAVILAACSEPRMTQTELRAAAGIVGGQTNDIRIGDVLYRIPPQYKLRFVDFNEEMVKANVKANEGAVWRVTFHMDLSSWFDPAPINPGEGNALVRIQISGTGYEDPVRKAQKFESKKWASRRDIPEWGLREYISARFPEQGGWGVLSYRALDAATPKGGPILYGCVENYSARKNNVAKAKQCGTGFQTEQGPNVGYMLSDQLLPRWKEVHSEVLNLVSSLIIEE